MSLGAMVAVGCGVLIVAIIGIGFWVYCRHPDLIVQDYPFDDDDF